MKNKIILTTILFSALSFSSSFAFECPANGLSVSESDKVMVDFEDAINLAKKLDAQMRPIKAEMNMNAKLAEFDANKYKTQTQNNVQDLLIQKQKDLDAVNKKWKEVTTKAIYSVYVNGRGSADYTEDLVRDKRNVEEKYKNLIENAKNNTYSVNTNNYNSEEYNNLKAKIDENDLKISELQEKSKCPVSTELTSETKLILQNAYAGIEERDKKCQIENNSTRHENMIIDNTVSNDSRCVCKKDYRIFKIEGRQQRSCLLDSEINDLSNLVEKKEIKIASITYKAFKLKQKGKSVAILQKSLGIKPVTSIYGDKTHATYLEFLMKKMEESK